jgi:hypothetical protein
VVCVACVRQSTRRFHPGNSVPGLGFSRAAGLTIFTNFLKCRGRGAALFRPARNGKAGLACIGANRENEMPSFSDVKYVYDPEALKIMGAAFDTVCHAFPPDLKEHEGARRRLALLILRHMDRREHEVARLSDLALLDFMRPLALEQR